MTEDTPITRQCRFPNCACLDKRECVAIREDEALLAPEPQAEGISQSILAAAAEAADLEPVSEAGGEDLPWDTPEFKAMMADRFDHLVDYWDSEGMPEGVEMKLRELLADETPDPALMKDVLFVLDADNGQARAVITDDGIRLEGVHSSHGLLGEAIKVLPLILERERDRKLYATTTLAEADKAIRYAIESGENTDAAGELIEDLWRWLNGNPENPNIWINEGLAALAAFSTAMEQHTCEDAAVKAALDTDDELRGMVGMKPGKATAGIVDRMEGHMEPGKWFAERAYKLNAHRGSGDDQPTTVTADGASLSVGPMPVDLLSFTVGGKNGEELAKAYARAATMGTAWLRVTSAHAEGVTVKLMQPSEVDPDFADLPMPQDSDAPDGEGARNSLDERMLNIAARIAYRDGAAILSFEKGSLVALNGHIYKVKRNKHPLDGVHDLTVERRKT